MELSHNKLIEKWGFWLALYTFVSVLLTFQESVILSNGTVGIIFIPGFLGGILYLYFGAKFRSAIFLSVGLTALLPVISLTFTYFSFRKIYCSIVLTSCCLLIARRSEMSFGKDSQVEKWGIWLPRFAMVASFVVCCLYLLVKIFHRSLAKLFLLSFVIIVIPCMIGGIRYLYLGAKQRSFRYASMGLAVLMLGCMNFMFLFPMNLFGDD